MDNTENEHFADKISNAFKKAAVEIEELQVQIALGKAEAYEKYDDVKKKFNHFMHDAKSKVNTGKDKINDIHAKFDHLRVQLALGKAETLEAFQEQKKKILLAIHDIEVKIKHNETVNQVYAILIIELENFKLQLEVLEQKFKNGKEGAKETFEKGKTEFFNYVEKIKSKFSKKEENKWEHFQDEISEAFSHFKSAFVSSK